MRETTIEHRIQRNTAIRTILSALLGVLACIGTAPAELSAQPTASARRKTAPPPYYGFAPAEVLTSGIPFFYRAPCCGNRLDLRAQLAVSHSYLYWADSSDTPIKKMSTSGGAVTPLVRLTGSPVNAVIRGDQVYWIEHGDGPGFNRPLPSLNRTSFDGATTTMLDEGDRYFTNSGAKEILVTETDAYWVNTVDATMCNEYSCFGGYHKWLVRKVPLNGAPPTTLVITEIGQVISSIATDGVYLYWQEDGQYMASSNIKKIPVTGGDIIVVVDGVLNGLATTWEPIGGIFVSSGEVFFAAADRGLMKVSISGGAPTALTSAEDSILSVPRKFAVDAVNLYWIDTGALRSVPRSGGTVTTLASGLGLTTDLLVRNGYAIWAEDYCCGRTFTGSIKAIPTAGGAPTSLARGLEGVRGLDRDLNTLVFVEGPSLDQGMASGRIAKLDGAGIETTIVTAVMADFVSPIAVDDLNVYFADRTGLKKVSVNGGVVHQLAAELETGDVSAMVADGQFVYWLTPGRNPAVRKIPVDGGPIETLVQTVRMYSSSKLVLKDGFLYWVQHSHSVPMADAIMKISVDGGSLATIVSGLAALDDFAIDGTDLYFAELAYQTTIRRVSIDGGPISDLGFLDDSSVLTADDGNVYWANPWVIGMASRSGGTARQIAASSGNSIAIDPDGIYWMQWQGNMVKLDRSVLSRFLTVVSPRSGETWPIKSQQSILWWFNNIGDKVTISLSRDGGLTWRTLFRNIANNRVQTWKVTKPATTQAIIRVCSVAAPVICDSSDPFTIR